VKIYEDFAPNFGSNRAACYIMAIHHLRPPFFTVESSTKDSMAVISYPPRFLLFLQLIIKLKGHHFDTVEVIKVDSEVVLNTLMEQDFQNAFKKWQKH
jgi:hypothetical protein